MIKINFISDFVLFYKSFLRKIKKFIILKFFKEEFTEALLRNEDKIFRQTKKFAFHFNTLPIDGSYPNNTNLKKATLAKYNKDVIFIIQGPVTEYTLQTIEIYKKIFPEAGISIGTWNDTDLEIVKKLRKKIKYLGFAKKPNYPGFMNINFQLKSTKAGYNNEFEKNYKYILKQRSDQRINRLDALAYLTLKLKNNPEKIVILSNGTSSQIRYHIGDHLTFSNIKKFNEYWMKAKLKNIEDDKNTRPLIKYSLNYRDGKNIYPEQWLGNSYKKLIYGNHEISQLDFILNCFVVINSISIRLHFNKYNTFLSEIQLNEYALTNPQEYVEKEDPKLDAIEYEILIKNNLER